MIYSFLIPASAQYFACLSKVKWRVNKIAVLKIIYFHLRKNWNSLKGNSSVFCEHEINDITNTCLWYLLADFSNERERKVGGRGRYEDRGILSMTGFPPPAGYSLVSPPQQGLYSSPTSLIFSVLAVIFVESALDCNYLLGLFGFQIRLEALKGKQPHLSCSLLFPGN